jgi:hypothetical protein
MARPKTNKVTRLDYCQYLFSSQINYTLTNFAEHVETLSHDMVNRYLRDEKLTPTLVWEHAKVDIRQSRNGFIVFDDSNTCIKCTQRNGNYSCLCDNIMKFYSALLF